MYFQIIIPCLLVRVIQSSCVISAFSSLASLTPPLRGLKFSSQHFYFIYIFIILCKG